jgi:RNA polymerase sigma-54 factor
MFQSTHLRPTTALRPLTTAHLAQTMALLELSAAELDQKIEAALAKNPALELRDTRRCPVCGMTYPETGACPRCAASHATGIDQPVVFVSPRQDFYTSRRADPLDQPEENLPQAIEDLPTFVLRQIAPELAFEDRRLAAHILSNLDEDGLLEIQPIEIARYHHASLERVWKVLRQIQRAEPVGVGSPSPQEALLAQLEVLAESRPVPPLAARAISEGMDLMSHHQYGELGRLLGVSARRAQEIAAFIGDNLNPYPARACWGDIRQGHGAVPSVYVYPDAVISWLQDGASPQLMVEVVSPFAGLLRVNPLFRHSLSEAPPERAEGWRTDLDQAELLVKCLQQRNNTLVRLMRRIAVLQREFILNGDEYLQPLTRASLAEELQVHESTISRAVSAKSVQLPNGRIVPLARFFDRSLHVRAALKAIIDQETSPLSDNEIVGVLNRLGFSVARRTVAKYRAMEGILPSHLRQAGSQAGAA